MMTEEIAKRYAFFTANLDPDSFYHRQAEILGLHSGLSPDYGAIQLKRYSKWRDACTVAAVDLWNNTVEGFCIAARPSIADPWLAAAVGFDRARAEVACSMDWLICELHVDIQHRRHGLGRELLIRSLYLAPHDCGLALIGVGSDNIPARNLYAGIGFTSILPPFKPLGWTKPQFILGLSLSGFRATAPNPAATSP